LGIPPGSSICITVGRAHPYKRIDFVIEVARLCAGLGVPGLYFVHCGDGPDLDRLESLRDQAGLQDRFVFAGRRSDIPMLLCSSHYALHPAKGEAFSLAILEYMSAGLAVLVPDIPTVRQAIVDGETGVIFADGDAAAAAGSLVALHTDPNHAVKLGVAASAEVRRSYSFSSMNQRFRRLIGDVLARVSPGRL
jgi:glycosyltransferase involved in cell wall biosynthesis